MEPLYPYFSDDELRCHCGQCGLGQEDMAIGFMRRLVALREACGFPLPLTSAIRCPAYNNAISTTGFNGPHTTGHAVDIRVNRHRALLVVVEAHKLGFTGYGVKQHGSDRYIHLDDLSAPACPRPTLWSY